MLIFELLALLFVEILFGSFVATYESSRYFHELTIVIWEPLITGYYFGYFIERKIRDLLS
jgi:hypothetical protein